MAELDELGRFGLVGVRSNDGRIRDPAGLLGGNSVANTPFGTLRLTDAGTRLVSLGGVATVGEAERAEWVARLAAQAV
jgi:hypothetical protein